MSAPHAEVGAAAPRARQRVDAAQRVRDQALERLQASDLREALRLYDYALGYLTTEDGRNARWLSERGRTLMALAQHDLAIRDFDRAMHQDPKLLSPVANKATALQNMGRLHQALEMHERACNLRPNRADVHYNRGNALMELDRQEDGLAAYKRAVEVEPGFQRAYAGLINGLWQHGALDEAQAYADQACRVTPNEPENFAARALVLQTLGDLAGARADYQHALGIDPHSVGALFNWVQMDKVRDAEDWRLARLRDAEGTTLNHNLDRASLHYALGKCYDDLSEVDSAFHHFDRGARIKRTHLVYNEEHEKRLVGQLTQNFTCRAIEAYEPRGLTTEQPVFVVGMPRSGTTLTEQILHSHPQVFGAGELAYMNDAVSGISLGGRLLQKDGNPDRHGLEVLPERAETYLTRLCARAADPEIRRIVDKMPGNAWRIGFIHLMFPNARIIHCVRDPLDTCLSCFQKLFSHGQQWSYDLRELGRHYRRYERVMRHWEEVLPGRVLTVRYEETVADLESQARRIIDHVGLPWDPACLEFHRAKRAVQTASHSQVREPLYASSVRRWEAYRHHLQPLVDALGPLADHAREAPTADANQHGARTRGATG